MGQTNSTTTENNSQYDSTYGCFANINRQVHLIQNLKSIRLQRLTQFNSNTVLVLRNCTDCEFLVLQNQRCAQLILIGCKNVTFSILDSAVITTKTLRLIDCDHCQMYIEYSDVRKIECWNVTNTNITYLNGPTITRNARIIWHDQCRDNTVSLDRLIIYDIRLHTTNIKQMKVPPSEAPLQYLSYFDEHEEIHTKLIIDAEGKPSAKALKLISDLTPHILAVFPSDKTESSVLREQILSEIETLSKQAPIPKEEIKSAMEAERSEVIESDETIEAKISQVISLIKSAKHVLIYTGAGISTSANIPDFRGPNGVWTLRDFGKKATNKTKKISDAMPTYAHYAITELVRRNIFHFVISTNMDCLHVRSGLPKHLIIEQHGNCHKEVCQQCGMEHWRSYPVGSTVLKTREHLTYRFCKWCKGNLQDTIVHFSENYHEVNTQPISLHHAYKADLVIVLGTSMLVQPNATYPEVVLRKPEGHMVIVNLQKTPYDHLAHIRLFCTTDLFMELIMSGLKIKKFDQESDCRSEWDTITEEEIDKCFALGAEDLDKRNLEPDR